MGNSKDGEKKNLTRIGDIKSKTRWVFNFRIDNREEDGGKYNNTGVYISFVFYFS